MPDAELDRIAAQGFDWVYFLGVWSTGEAGRQVSRSNPEWRHEFAALLPDLEERDICGSSFAVTAYAVHPAMGGDAALERLRAAAARTRPAADAGLRPQPHGAGPSLGAGTARAFRSRRARRCWQREPGNYVAVETAAGPVVLAHGRDPYFPGWPDTLQLDYGNPATREAMRGELLAAASLCDGLRCDMAMLILPEVFQRTWGVAAEPFWPGAIQAVRAARPDFVFMAEVYWDLEWTMLQQGFDYAYDKTLYDRAVGRNGRGIREHLRAGLDYQRHLVRFLENHDEPRAAGTFPWEVHQAAAVLAFLTPGLRFFHQGQFEGRRKRVSIHLNRAPAEPADPAVGAFYGRLLRGAEAPGAARRRLAPARADRGLAGQRELGRLRLLRLGGRGRRAPAGRGELPAEPGAVLRQPAIPGAGRPVADLIDLLGPARYRREGDALTGRGLYLDLPPWGFHLFGLEAAEPGGSALSARRRELPAIMGRIGQVPACCYRSLALAGCGSIGPSTVPRDRIGYLAAVGESWKEQTLLNVVRLRYGDAPTFLEVSSIISGYGLQGQLSAGGQVSSDRTNTIPSSLATLGATGTYLDRPTISYTPLAAQNSPPACCGQSRPVRCSS